MHMSAVLAYDETDGAAGSKARVAFGSQSRTVDHQPTRQPLRLRTYEGPFLLWWHRLAADLAPQIINRKRACERTQGRKVSRMTERCNQTAGQHGTNRGRSSIQTQKSAACGDHLRRLELIVHVRDRQGVQGQRGTTEERGQQ